MFTTLAETYMIATRMDSIYGYRAGESERLRIMHERREAKRAWIEEQMKEAKATHRRARFLDALRWIGHRLTAAGQALSRFAGDTAPKTPECC